MNTNEVRFYAYVRIEDRVVVLRPIDVEVTPKLIKAVSRFQLSNTGLLHVQWPRNPEDSSYGCPLAKTGEQALADLQRRLTREVATLESQLAQAKEALAQTQRPLVPKKGRLSAWWEGQPTVEPLVP